MNGLERAAQLGRPLAIMIEMEQLLDQLMRSPKLEFYFRQIGDALAKEKAARIRFYNEITEQDKAEFINGEAIYHSPVRLVHNDTRTRLSELARAFVRVHGLGKVADEKLMISLTRNDYEPDVSFWRSEISQRFVPDQLHFPAPDWIAEVLSESTEERDRGVKFEDYAAHGVKEYWIVDPEHAIVEQYLINEAGAFDLHIRSDSGTLRSTAIQGFEIPVAALFDDAVNLTVLRTFLAVGS